MPKKRDRTQEQRGRRLARANKPLPKNATAELRKGYDAELKLKQPKPDPPPEPKRAPPAPDVSALDVEMLPKPDAPQAAADAPLPEALSADYTNAPEPLPPEPPPPPLEPDEPDEADDDLPDPDEHQAEIIAFQHEGLRCKLHKAMHVGCTEPSGCAEQITVYEEITKDEADQLAEAVAEGVPALTGQFFAVAVEITPKERKWVSVLLRWSSKTYGFPGKETGMWALAGGVVTAIVVRTLKGRQALKAAAVRTPTPDPPPAAAGSDTDTPPVRATNPPAVPDGYERRT